MTLMEQLNSELAKRNYAALRNNNVNDNVVLNKTNNVNNDNVNEREVNNLAYKLTNELNNPSAFKFYCKVAWHLTEAQIFNNLELAKKHGKSPVLYFSWLCKRDLNNLSKPMQTE